MSYTFISIWPDLIQLTDRDLPCQSSRVVYFPHLSVNHHQGTRLGKRMRDGMGSDLVDFYARARSVAIAPNIIITIVIIIDIMFLVRWSAICRHHC